MSAAVVAAALFAPAAGLAEHAASPPGGTGAVGLTGTSGNGSAIVGVKPANVTATVSGNGITITTDESGLLHHRLVFAGSVAGAAAGDTVEIERRAAGTNGKWVGSTSSLVAVGGSFSATWSASESGRFAIRALVLSEPAVTPGLSIVSPALAITVYGINIASIYGPGLYGHKTACGETLRRNTLGVANVKLKCGTPIALDFAGRTIVVPVIDRGPYVKGVEWDLTEATARALGMLETEAIGAAALPMP